MTAPAPLDGVRVVDLTRYLAGPFCTQLLADYGADVVRVESPKGREFTDASGRDTYFFLTANRGKRSIALDIRSDQGGVVLGRLLERADVLVENFRPGVLEGLGFAPDDLLAKHSRAEAGHRDRPELLGPTLRKRSASRNAGAVRAPPMTAPIAS